MIKEIIHGYLIIVHGYFDRVETPFSAFFFETRHGLFLSTMYVSLIQIRFDKCIQKKYPYSYTTLADMIV